MLYLRNASFVDWRTLKVRRGHLEVAPGAAGKVRFISRIPRGAKALDCSERLVTKSFVIAHHHLYSALACGMPMAARAPKNFPDMLKLVWWNLDRELDKAMIRACALAGGIAAAKAGSTFIIDHHSSPNAVKGSLGIIADALDEIGLGHLLCVELSDRDGKAKREAGLEETDNYLRKRQGLVGLHASFTVGDDLLYRAIAMAIGRNAGLHIHVAEAIDDQKDCVKTHGMRVVQRLARTGILESPKTLLVHGLHLNAQERALFRSSRSWIVQNEESNQNNAVGGFDAKGLGDRLLLGTDGMHGDMLASTRAAYLAAQGRGGMSPLAAYRRLRRAHDYLSENGFSGDGENNLVILDYRPPTPISAKNMAAHFLYGLTGKHVDSVISQGKLIVRRGRMTTVDEDKVQRFALKQTERLWRRL
ncbi:MAG: amidohydrolase [Elusimicrobia bacterium CG11_big_fil_rev_8_21_14_0_20_64_6]|nr:MAG: amidohydrolase [Elusimicrobia bacterium CG11_big_fil_rev_8_21_14_0_20_64_6]